MEENIALTRLYHPTGAQVSIPLSLVSEITPEQGALLSRSLDNLLTSGWSVNLPGVEAGENVAEIGFVARREKYNTGDSTTTPIVDLYENKDPKRGGAFKLIHLYLNTPEDVAAFEMASGLPLGQIPLYEADAAIERGKGKDKYVVACPRLPKLVWKQNPAYEGQDDKKHAKRLFVRWHGSQRPNESRPATVSVLQADPETGEITSDQESVYLVGSKDLVELLLQTTGLKPPAFMPLLAQSGQKHVTLAQAQAIIAAGLGAKQE